MYFKNNPLASKIALDSNVILDLAGLKDLMLAGCCWSSVSALCSSGCPLLRSLDLRYADGVKDVQIRDLVTPPGEEAVG